MGRMQLSKGDYLEVIKRHSIITKRVLNEATGELESVDFTEETKRSKLRGGFNLMYHKSYEEITEKVINSNTDLKVFNWITNSFTYQRVEVPLTYSQCEVKVSQPQYARLLKKLVEESYLKRVARGVYRLNPYIYIPYRADGSELQAEWSELNL